jgi:hypothetical protein
MGMNNTIPRKYSKLCRFISVAISMIAVAFLFTQAPTAKAQAIGTTNQLLDKCWQKTTYTSPNVLHGSALICFKKNGTAYYQWSGGGSGGDELLQWRFNETSQVIVFDNQKCQLFSIQPDEHFELRSCRHQGVWKKTSCAFNGQFARCSN